MLSNSTAFDPYTQPFTLLLADGVTPFNLTVADLDAFNFYNMKVVANYGTQMGASIIMFALVLLITNPNKRKSRLFWINLTSLALCIVRNLLQIFYWTGPFSEAFAFFAFDYSAVPRSAYANSIAASVMTFLLLCCVELSLFMQVKVITRAMMGDRYRWTLLAISGVVVTLAVGFRFGQLIHNCEAIINTTTSTRFEWLSSACLITETISIWYFCIIFVTKLGYCIWERKKKLGLKPWGPMDVICIMGGCTMIIPSIFAVLQYFPASTFPEAGTLTIVLVSIFLPMSSIWAAATPEGGHPIFRSKSSSPNSIGSSERSKLACTHSTVESERKSSVISPGTVTTMVEHSPRYHDDTDLRFLTEDTKGVKVERTYSVHSGRGENVSIGGN